MRARIRSRGRVIGLCVCVYGPKKKSCLSELDTFMDCSLTVNETVVDRLLTVETCRRSSKAAKNTVSN